MPSFITQLAELIKNNYDLAQKELTVVFPNKRAAFYLRSKFKEIYHENIWLPQMLSIEEAVTQWSGIQLVDTLEMLFELISIDSELFSNDNSISVFGNMATQMANDFDEIDQYEVDAKHLFSYVKDEKKLGLWEPDKDITPKEQQFLKFFESLNAYYDRLRENLQKQGKGYYGMITRELASLSDEELLRRVGDRQVIFAGFNALTPTEQKIIDKLYKNQRAEVVWDFDNYYVEDEKQEAGWFARRYIRDNRPWKPSVFSESLLQDEKEIHIVGANGNTVQAKALQSLLEVENKPHPVVVLADENLMIPVLNAIPDSPKYDTIKISMGYPLKHTSIHHLVSDFFTLRRSGRKVQDKGWYLWPILRIFDTELVKVIFTAEENRELERYQSFVAMKSAYVFKHEEFDSYCKSKDLRRFTRLLVSENPNAEAHPTDVLDALVELLAFAANKIQQTDTSGNAHFLLNQISDTGKVVNRLKNVISRYPHYVKSLDELQLLYRIVSTNSSIKLNSSSTNGLQLMGILEARNLDFDTVYMIGVNEGVLPTDKSNSSFIPYPIRKECGLPDYQEKQAVYAYHFYRQLQRAKKAYFIYNSNAEGGGEPSRFLMQLKFELAKSNPKIKLIEENFSNLAAAQIRPKLLKANKTDDVKERLMKKVCTSEYRQALAPTSLSCFLQCPFKFFLKYIMRIEDNSTEEETQSNIIGLIVHDTLERHYKDYCNTVISKELLKRITDSHEAVLNDVLQAKFAHGLSDVGYNYLNQLTIKRMFDTYFAYETRAVENHELVISNVEYTLHTTLEVNGVSCTLAGKADRIDCYDGKVRIIDYKTGVLNSADVTVPEDLQDLKKIPEKALQLLIYKYLYLKEHDGTRPDDVTAALFGLKNQQVVFDLKVLNTDLNEHFMEVMEAYLTGILSEMIDPEKPFSQPEEGRIKSCDYCDFKVICTNIGPDTEPADGR